MKFPTQEEHEKATHSIMGWPDKRPKIDPVAQRELDKLWETIHGTIEKEKESPSDST